MNMKRRIRARRYQTDFLTAASTADCRVFATYLYTICMLDTEKDDNDVACNMVNLFFKLAAKLNVTNEVKDFLAQEVQNLEKSGILSIDPEFKPSSDLMFDYSNVPYKYREDKTIDRNMPGSLRNVDETVVNMFRCLQRTKTEDFFCKLVANFLIRKSPSASFGLIDSFPPYITRELEKTDILDFVSKPANLDEKETLLLVICYRIRTCALLNSLYNNFSSERQHEILTELLHVPTKNYNAIIRAGSKLRAYGFLDESGFIEDDFIECINASSMQPFFNDLLKKCDTEKSYSIESFNIPSNTTTIMSRMLKGNEPVSLMLYGKPGSGKTEYAKALAHDSGRNVFIFKNESELSHEGCPNILCRLNCLLSVAAGDSVIIIDEADTLLETRSTSFLGVSTPSTNKGTVNKMLEENKNKIIWIVNFTDQIDESTLRRFTYSCKFDSMSRQQLRSIATTKIAPLALGNATSAQILDLMDRYHVTGASVDNVIKTIKSLGGTESDRKELVDCVRSVLKENSVLLNGKSKMRDSVNKCYDLKALNTNMNPEQIVRMIQNAEKFAEQNRTSENGIRMLFYGLSGTGKTEFARYIAEQLGKKILLKRASDILDKYVGGSEQNIRDAFEEAERTESILLFDEADTFFADRENAEHSWERSQVNEFLTQMEEFSGILICTTNLRSIMDSAMNRRFHMIVEFKPLDFDGIKSMAERYFGSISFEEEQLHRLERTGSVTPGDFGVLASRIRFMDEEERTPEFITNEICKMQEEKDGNAGHNTIGFCA